MSHDYYIVIAYSIDNIQYKRSFGVIENDLKSVNWLKYSTLFLKKYYFHDSKWLSVSPVLGNINIQKTVSKPLKITKKVAAISAKLQNC